jgi:hypothetical protein
MVCFSLDKGIICLCMSVCLYSCCSHLEHTASMKCFISLQFLNLRQSVGLLGWVISPLQGCYLTQTQNKHRQTSMPWVGFEPTTSVFEWAKTFDALDCAVTVISNKDTNSKCKVMSGEYNIISLFQDYPTAIYCDLLAPYKKYWRPEETISNAIWFQPHGNICVTDCANRTLLYSIYRSLQYRNGLNIVKK